MIFFLGYFLFGIAAVAVLAGISYVVFPWTAHLGFCELPAAFWALLSGPPARRRLRFLLKARYAADRDRAATLPEGEMRIVSAVRWVAGRELAFLQWMLAKLTASPFGPPGARYRGHPVPGPVTAAFLEQARVGSRTVSLPGMRYCQCAGCEAGRSRAQHDRYERDFVNAIRDKRAGRFL